MPALKRALVISILTAHLFAALFGVAQATPPQPVVPLHPPRPPLTGIQEEPSPAAPGTLALSGLKAVLIVGSIDGDYGSWTTQEKGSMDLAAAELTANGVEVHKFYAPSNNWEQIKTAANGAHFLMYRGHGVALSGTNPPQVGGFALSGGVFKLSDAIRSDLKLATNAIVMLYGCYTAGSDDQPGDIAINEARRRVIQYSDPFFDIDAAGYYANWYGNAFQYLVRYLFQGQALGQAYDSYNNYYNHSTVSRSIHPDRSNNVLWVGANNWSGYNEYNNTFSGLENKTLEDLFKGMDVEPKTKLHLAEPSYPPYMYTVAVESNITGQSFNWTATISPTVAWMTAYPLSGGSGQDITVVITPTGQAMGTYETAIRVVADDPAMNGGDQTSVVKLIVADQIYGTYLPIVSRP